MARVVHFEMYAVEPEKAVAFYQTVFGWEFHRWDGPMDYWLIKTGPDGEPGINGGLTRRPSPIDGTVVIGYVCTVDVPSVDAAVATIVGAGGEIAMPKMAIPGVGWLAYAKDTQGNIFGVMQRDPTAKS